MVSSCVIAESVGHRFLTKEFRIQFQVSSRRVLSTFLQFFFFFPKQCSYLFLTDL